MTKRFDKLAYDRNDKKPKLFRDIAEMFKTHPAKVVAYEFDVSRRTVHRAAKANGVRKIKLGVGGRNE